MAWYRTGGGVDIPAPLVTDMNAVLNKKMVTSTTYPWSQWAGTVNLMGKLPERTVSGAVASFQDGADDVPLVSLIADVTPNINGVSIVPFNHNDDTFTVSLGRTIYSGSVDVISGEGTSTWVRKIAGNMATWRRHSQGYFYIINSEVGDKAAGELNIIGEDLTTVRIAQISSAPYSIAGRASDGAIYVYLTGSETLEEFHAWIDDKIIVYEMITPEDFSTTPIQVDSKYGENQISNSVGNTTVTYRRDIELALANQPSLMMMASRPTIQEQPQEEEESTDESI